jgi:hypothetical protein
MTKLALIRLSDNSVVTAPIAEGSRVELPGVGCVSPAQAGWQGGGAITYDYAANEDHPEGVMEIAEEGSAQFKLLPIVDFVVPEGKQVSGAVSYSVDGESVTETYPVEDIPAPVELTLAEKLAKAGLTVDDLKTLLLSSATSC